jgi:hypothetical protein
MGVFEKCCLVLVLVGGCSKTVNQCTKDSDCTNIVYPFCDVNGEYPASDGEHNVCTPVPTNCPVERCGCQPGAVTCTDASTLTTCNADGKSVTTDACGLGCDTTDNRCFTFKPTNGMDGPLTASNPEAAVTLPTSVTIDTTACEIRDSNNQLVGVTSLTVAQLNAPAICAFYAGSFDITNAAVTGNNVLGFAAIGAITIHGTIDESAKPRFEGMLNAGPGSVTTGDCMGTDGGAGTVAGGGGAGNATAGGPGDIAATVPDPQAGGLAEQNFTPIFGGCAGTAINAGGGGALQLDSLTGIHVLGPAVLALGAQGGEDGNGGGAGGTIVFEAPLVEIVGGIAANGGGGSSNGSCTSPGSAATNDGVAAPGGVCNAASGGAGGTGTTPPGSGRAVGTAGAGGGGSVGRIMIRTGDGTFTGPGALFSIAKTTDTLVKH